jgi:dihydrolipoamide dehydrogenase
VDYQVGILGGGPGGYVCALRAAQLGLSVVLIEGERLGGTCLNRGCIPTKALVKSADLYREMEHAEEFGLFVGEKRVDYGAVVARKDQIVNALVGGVEKLMKAANIRVVKGWGEFKEVGQLLVTTENGVELIRVENVVLATGSVPIRIPISGADLPGVGTSDELLEEKELPKRLVVIGGGVIGLEFASIYKAFGVQVSVVEMLPTLLPTIDEEIPKRLTPVLKRSGMEIFTKTAVKEIRQEGENLIVQVEDGKGVRDIPADRVLLSTGRRPSLRGIDVDNLG